ncbi:MAG: hypothetical protein JWM86_535 [Thermoleophilia bacterium]|nr:hypothetical protein [Thermoleophilia bacterium]
MRRTQLFLLLVLATFVAAGCGEFGQRYEGDDSKDSGNDTTEKLITDEEFTAAVAKRDGCDEEAEEFESEGNDHVDISESVTYKQNPPMSGNHWNDPSVPAPADYGFYDATQRDEATVHNLEHGHIVITHKGLSDDAVDTLKGQWNKNDYHLLVEPRKKNPKDGVFYSAWTAQLFCKKPSAAALQYMIDNFRDQGPELFTDDPGGGEMGSGKKDN